MRTASIKAFLLATTLSPLLAAPAFAAAATTADTDTAERADCNALIVTATKVNEAAPIVSSLKTYEPQSIVNRSIIQYVVPATADFNDVILLYAARKLITTGLSRWSAQDPPG